MPDISVLIIDDEPSILKAVSMTLKQEHIAVTCADNGALALDILKANTFDSSHPLKRTRRGFGPGQRSGTWCR